jgi:hypothetical protein
MKTFGIFVWNEGKGIRERIKFLGELQARGKQDALNKAVNVYKDEIYCFHSCYYRATIFVHNNNNTTEELS